MIRASHISFNDDGTAWLAVEAPEFSGAEKSDLATYIQADRPCDTPDCDATGRHTFTIEVENPHCAANWPEHSVSDYNPACCRFPKSCSAFPITYRVSVVPDMVLPIYDHDELLDGAVSLPKDWAPHIDIMCGEPLLCTRSRKYPEDWDEDRIILPPAAKPGMWAVKLQVHR